MPKTVQYLIVKILVVTVFVSVLTGFGLALDKPKQGEAALDQEYGSFTCDEFIPLGSALNEVLDILDGAFKVYQGENMTLVMDNITGVISALTQKKNVCDFTKCVAQVDNQGPELGVQFDAFFWKGELTFKVPPWCAPKEGIGEPCPDVSQFLEANDENIMGLVTLRDSFMNSAETLHDIFETATEPLPADLARYLEDEDGNFIDKDGNIIPDEGEPVFDIEPGQKVTRADLALRMAERVELQLTPGTYKSCALSTLERKLVADGRIGDLQPMQCKQAYEEGLYWPRQWSLDCAEKCDGGSEKSCIECLAKDPGNKASKLAKINYKIYGQCEDSCRSKNIAGDFINEWALDDDCEACLCRKPATAAAGSGGITGGATEQMNDEECLAWLCGGSTANWVCCHQTPLEGRSDMPEIEPFYD